MARRLQTRRHRRRSRRRQRGLRGIFDRRGSQPRGDRSLMARTIHELRDLLFRFDDGDDRALMDRPKALADKIALVRKGFRPVHQGAVITIVKSEQEDRSVSDETTRTEASVVERLSKAIAGLLKPDAADEVAEVPSEPVTKADGDSATPAAASTESVEKAHGAELASVDVSHDGAHAAFDGTHTHGHVSHYAMLQHEHEHSHDGDAAHYHSHVSKAQETLPEGWRIVSADELRTALGVAPVAKADDSAADTGDESVSKAKASKDGDADARVSALIV